MQEAGQLAVLAAVANESAMMLQVGAQSIQAELIDSETQTDEVTIQVNTRRAQSCISQSTQTTSSPPSKH